MCMVGLAVMALAGCGKDAPTTGTVEVRGSGQEWSVASSKAETSKDGYNVKVLVKLDPKAEHGEYLPWGIGGDLTSKYDGDESGQGTLKNWCHSDVRHESPRVRWRLSFNARMDSMAAPRKYPAELQERATRLAIKARQDPERRRGAVRRVAEQLGVNPETLRNWVSQAEVDAGTRPGVTTSEHERLLELERENRELRRANAILRSASAFFAAELDRPHH